MNRCVSFLGLKHYDTRFKKKCMTFMKDKGGRFDKKVVFAYYFTYLLNGKAVIVFIYSIVFNM